jgi:molybdopterin molybdotransferase
VSALVVAGIFVVPVIHRLLGLSQATFRPSVPARLTLNLSSQAGREDWVAVKLYEDRDGYLAEPVFGKSNLIFTLSRCDGLVKIHSDATGLSAGSLVEVQLL